MTSKVRQAATVRFTTGNQPPVFRVLQRLLGGGADIVTRGFKDALAADAEVFVESEFHAAGSSGTFTKRSRAISAP